MSAIRKDMRFGLSLNVRGLKTIEDACIDFPDEIVGKALKKSFKRWLSHIKYTLARRLKIETDLSQKMLKNRMSTGQQFNANQYRGHLWVGMNPFNMARLAPLRTVRQNKRRIAGGVIWKGHLAQRAFIYKDPKNGKISVLRQEGPDKKSDLETVRLDLSNEMTTEMNVVNQQLIQEEFDQYFMKELKHNLKYYQEKLNAMRV